MSNSTVSKGSCRRYVPIVGLFIFAIISIACMASGLGIEILDALLKPIELSTMQQNNVDWVINHAYPGSHFIRADGQISDFNAGSSVYVAVTVTFDTPTSFDTVKAWYIQHPEGGRDGGDLDDFPKYGLEKLSDDLASRTTYRVTYLDGSECGWLADCEEPLHQIR